MVADDSGSLESAQIVVQLFLKHIDFVLIVDMVFKENSKIFQEKAL